jgi:hypothetical protein
LDSPSLLKRISPSCCGEPITNSVPAISQISRSSAAASARMRNATASRAATSSLMPRALRLVQDAHEGQLDGLEQLGQPALGDLLALALGQLMDEHRLGGDVVVAAHGHPALLAELGQRVAAARGIEQVGRHLGVEGQSRGTAPSDLASWATTGRLPAAAISSRGSAHSPASASSPPA